jgi:hypothetical protein
MRVLIAGGTGFIGRALQRALERRGDEIVVLSRDPGIRPDHASAKRMTHRMTWSELKQQGLPACDAVINLSGVNIFSKRWSKKFKNDIYTSRIESTRQLVIAINQAPHPPKVFISTSAVAWYPTDEKRVFTEKDSASNSFLGMVCQHWEAAAALKENCPTRCVIMRLGMVLGLGNPMIPKMLQLFRWGLGGKLGSGRQPFPWIHIDDLVAIYLFVLDHEKIEGVFNCVGPQQITNAEFTAALGSLFRRRTPISLPHWILKLLLGERSSLMTEGSYIVPERAIQYGFTFQFNDVESALTDLVKKFYRMR